jgi:hypothetical protein
LARLRHRRFFGVADLNAAIDILLEDSNNRVMRHAGKSGSCSRRSNAPRWRLCRRSRFEYAEWKNAKVRYERERLEAACERALAINAISYSSVSVILKSVSTGKAPPPNRSKPHPRSQHPWRHLLSMKERNPMLTNPTLDQMQALGLAGMAAAYRNWPNRTTDRVWRRE